MQHKGDLTFIINFTITHITNGCSNLLRYVTGRSSVECSRQVQSYLLLRFRYRVRERSIPAQPASNFVLRTARCPSYVPEHIVCAFSSFRSPACLHPSLHAGYMFLSMSNKATERGISYALDLVKNLSHRGRHTTWTGNHRQHSLGEGLALI